MYFKSKAALLSNNHYPGMKFNINLIAIKLLSKYPTPYKLNIIIAITIITTNIENATMNPYYYF
jgi:hypothetical protein